MDDTRTLYCGNLTKDVTEELLYELFLQAGPVDRVDMPKDKQGNKRNFGFIVFKHEVSVPYAVELMSGEKLFGQAMRLQQRGNNSESTSEISYHPAARHQKTMSCPPGFSFNHRNNYGPGNNRHAPRSNNGEDYRNQQIQQHNNPSTPHNGYNSPGFIINPMQLQNYTHGPVDLPLIQTQYSNRVNWSMRGGGNRWMRN